MTCWCSRNSLIHCRLHRARCCSFRRAGAVCGTVKFHNSFLRQRGVGDTSDLSPGVGMTCWCSRNSLIHCCLHRARCCSFRCAGAVCGTVKLHNPFLRQRTVRDTGYLIPAMSMTGGGFAICQVICGFYCFWCGRFGFIIAISCITQLRETFLRQCCIRMIS